VNSSATVHNSNSNPLAAALDASAPALRSPSDSIISMLRIISISLKVDKLVATPCLRTVFRQKLALSSLAHDLRHDNVLVVVSLSSGIDTGQRRCTMVVCADLCLPRFSSCAACKWRKDSRGVKVIFLPAHAQGINNRCGLRAGKYNDIALANATSLMDCPCLGG